MYGRNKHKPFSPPCVDTKAKYDNEAKMVDRTSQQQTIKRKIAGADPWTYVTLYRGFEAIREMYGVLNAKGVRVFDDRNFWNIDGSTGRTLDVPKFIKQRRGDAP